MKRITITLHPRKGKAKRYTSDRAITRIINRISLVKFLKAYIYCTYGKKLNHENKLVTFYNDGWVLNPKHGIELIKTFWHEK